MHPRNKDIPLVGGRAGHLLSLGAPSHQDSDGMGASCSVKADLPQCGVLDKNPRPLHRRNGRPPPHPTRGVPLTPHSPWEYSHVLGGQRPALHHADIQGAALGHGAQPQTFRAGGRPGSEAGPRKGGRASTYHPLRARRPVPESERRLSETRVAGREVSEGGETIGVHGGGVP